MAIEWTDKTWNPITGCTRVSEGCRHCYIERTPPFRMAGRVVGDPIELHPDRLDAPLHWRTPRRVFVNSLSDVFHEQVPDEYLDQMFEVMRRAYQHTFQVLTKRPERARRYLTRLEERRGTDHVRWPLSNVWMGASVEEQQTANLRIPILLETPAAVRFISAEPLLGPVDLSNVRAADGYYDLTYFDGPGLFDRQSRRVCDARIDWLIVGGESGSQARPCHAAWIRSLIRQCRTARVPCFVKQLGSYVVDRNDRGFEGDTPDAWPMGTRFEQVPSERDYQGSLGQVVLHKKGGDPLEWPQDLRVRQWP